MIKIQVKINQADLDRAEQIALDIVAQRAIKGLDNIVGPHLLEVAKARAPVGKRETKNPQRSSFQAVRPARREEGRFTSEELDTLRTIRGLSETPGALAGAFRKAFGSSRNREFSKFFRGEKGTPNEGKTPDVLRLGRGGVRGAFIHKPGTLRDSHILIPAKRVSENRVEAEVRATAPYAAAQHEGFQHHSHGKKTGTFVKGRKWLVEALGNVTDELNSSATYEG